MARVIKDAVDSGKYDIVIASQIDTAAYADSLRGCKAIFDEVEIGGLYEVHLKTAGAIQRLRSRLTWEKHRRYLSRVLLGYRACTVASIYEQQLLAETIPEYNEVYVIPNCIEFQDYQKIKAEPEPNTLIFTGSFRYSANYEAMRWFIHHVYPTIRIKIPDVVLAITGDPAGKDLSNEPNIVQTGMVEDIRTLIASSRVALAPILSGGGTRLKILEAMALGTPVVATPKGAQGLDPSPGEDILIANTPEEFAEAIISLLLDDDLRNRLAANGKRLVKEKYNWDSVLPKFHELLDHVAMV